MQPAVDPASYIKRSFGPNIKPDEIVKTSFIAKGEYGSVYAGKCRAYEVAIKVPLKQKLTEQNLANFRKEVQIMSEIFHPNVCLFMGACTEMGNISIISELMEGSLTKLLKSNVNYPLSTRMNWALEAARGVSWLHANNPPVIHMDLKPDNILYDSNLRIKVCDFGFSIFKEGTKATIKQPTGTPLYMSPEIIEVRANNPAQITEKVDVYSFAIILWEILSRKDAFAHHKNYILFSRAVRGGERPIIPTSCPPELATLIQNCWTKDPAARPNFKVIVRELENIVELCKIKESEEEIDKLIEDLEGRKFWKKHFLGKLTVPWQNFVESFWGELQMELPKLNKDSQESAIVSSDGYISCGDDVNDDTRSMLALKTLLVSDNESVSCAMFGKLLGWFGPLQFPYHKCGMLDKIVNLLKLPAFHGFMSSNEATAILKANPPGSFLIRFSANHPKSYCISRVDTNHAVKHLVIPYDSIQGSFVTQSKTYNDLYELMSAESNNLHLKKSLPCDQFSWLFDSKIAETKSGYVPGSDDEEMYDL